MSHFLHTVRLLILGVNAHNAVKVTSLAMENVLLSLSPRVITVLNMVMLILRENGSVNGLMGAKKYVKNVSKVTT